MRAYLDIETSFDGKVTVVGIYRPSRDFTQFIRPKIEAEAILDFLDGAETIITFNGLRFDLPVIEKEFGLKLATSFNQAD
ncbi:MAG: ribonuclease H-like domain-containing protein, partial [Actinomycetota bacterium]|nr:ribonuclease H-like domain-containing protein [Actinomycetota bacterium]